MPFAKGAHQTVTNEGSKPVPSCYFNIDYRLDDQPAKDTRYFHTQYRQAFPGAQGRRLPAPEQHRPRTLCRHFPERDGQQRWLVGRGNTSSTSMRQEAHDRRHGQRGLFLRGMGLPACLLESLFRRAPLRQPGERGREARHPQYLLPLAHPRSGALYEVAAGDDRARQRRPERRPQSVAKPLFKRRLLLPGSCGRRWCSAAAVRAARAQACSRYARSAGKQHQFPRQVCKPPVCFSTTGTTT